MQEKEPVIRLKKQNKRIRSRPLSWGYRHIYVKVYNKEKPYKHNQFALKKKKARFCQNKNIKSLNWSRKKIFEEMKSRLTWLPHHLSNTLEAMETWTCTGPSIAPFFIDDDCQWWHQSSDIKSVVMLFSYWNKNENRDTLNKDLAEPLKRANVALGDVHEFYTSGTFSKLLLN